jgi:hypothetical protein
LNSQKYSAFNDKFYYSSSDTIETYNKWYVKEEKICENKENEQFGEFRCKEDIKICPCIIVILI